MWKESKYKGVTRMGKRKGNRSTCTWGLGEGYRCLQDAAQESRGGVLWQKKKKEKKKKSQPTPGEAGERGRGLCEGEVDRMKVLTSAIPVAFGLED